MPKYYDTNALLNFPNLITESKEKFYINYISYVELESIKTSTYKDNEIKHKAREVVRLLNNNTDKFEVCMDGRNECTELGFDSSCNDNIILASVIKLNQHSPIEFCTNDLLLKLRARSLGIKVVDQQTNVQDKYKGYTYIRGNSDYINDYMNDIDLSKWYANQYLIIENTDDNKVTEQRYDGTKFVSLKLPPSTYIKAKNSLQRCALDMLYSKDITTVAVLGTYGSGKTFLAMQMALYNVMEKGHQSKILGVREALGDGKSVGYLKGDFEDKTGKFFKPLEQQLKGGEFELNSLMSREVLETNIPYYLKGTTYNDTVFIVDEAEDLTESQIKLIGTRVGQNSKIFFSGDFNQSVTNNTENNPLVRMCEELKGNPLFACIYLDEDVRSETSKLFANLYR